jgi:hypothetical protein
MDSTLTERVEASAQRLFPHLNRVQVLMELLLERAQKNLIKYQTLARQFSAKYATTNWVLIYGGRRRYARDQVGGIWHRHTAIDPTAHDISPDGRKPVDLAQFLDEIEEILADLELP